MHFGLDEQRLRNRRGVKMKRFYLLLKSISHYILLAFILTKYIQKWLDWR